MGQSSQVTLDLTIQGLYSLMQEDHAIEMKIEKIKSHKKL